MLYTTGGTQGLGLGITSHVLQHNAAKIIVVSQQEVHAKEAMDHLKQYGDTSKVHWVQCDFKNLKQVDEVAKKLAKEEPRLDVLVANAGMFCSPLSITSFSYPFPSQLNILVYFMHAQIHGNLN